MSNIKGIQLKAVHNFMGREGWAFTANIYFNNKKVGEVSDIADGSGEFELFIKDSDIKKEIARLSKEYFNKNPKYYCYYSEKVKEKEQEYGIICEMVEELKLLYEVEKEFKKNTKKGYPITILAECNERTKDIMDKDYVSGETNIHGVKKWDKETKDFIKKNYPQEKVFTVYEKLEDFIIK